MRSLGWAEFLNVSITPNRKVLAVSYWMYVFVHHFINRVIQFIDLRRKPPVVRLPPKLAVPLHGGTVTISMVEGVRASHTSSSKAKVLAQLQYTSKLGSRRPSDKVESLKFEVRWEPTPNAIGIHIPPEEYMLPTGMLLVVWHCQRSSCRRFDSY